MFFQLVGRYGERIRDLLHKAIFDVYARIPTLAPSSNRLARGVGSPLPGYGSASITRCSTAYPEDPSVEPLVPLVEVDELAVQSLAAVLSEDLVDRSSQTLGVTIREFVLVVQEDTSVASIPVEPFEVPGVVRQKDDIVSIAPLEQFGVGRPFADAVFRLFDVIATFTEDAFENPTDVFV